MALPQLFSELEPYLSGHLQLANGLERTEIDRILQHFPYRVAEEIYQLYQWHNGAIAADTYQDGLVAGYTFLPLQKAIAEYQNLLAMKPVWQDNWLPIFQFDPQTYYVIFGTNKTEPNCSIYDYFMQDSQLSLKFSSVQQMIEVLITAYKTSVYQWCDQKLVVDEIKFAEILRTHHPTQSISVLAQLAKVETAEQLGAIADQLMQLKDRNAVPYLTPMLTSNDPHLQSLACLILGEIKDKAVIPHLLACLSTTHDYGVKLSLLSALFSLPDPTIIPHLLPCLHHPDTSIVCAGISTLSAILISHATSTVPPDILSALLHLLEHENFQIRLSSGGILCRLGDRTALQVVAELINHNNLAVRLKAISCLAQCPLPEARALVQTCLSDRDDNVRLAAQSVLNSLI